MLDAGTIWRAKTILGRGEVIPSQDCTGKQFSFKVRQRNGDWTDVYVTIENGMQQWSCNALRKEGKNPWSCALYTGDRSSPYCSHTKAVDLWLEKKGVTLCLEENS